MGAWGVKSFENDDAADWVLELTDQGGQLVRETLDAALQDVDEDGLEASACCEAIAAAEIVAAAKTGDKSRLSDSAIAAFAALPAAELAAPENLVLANESLERIKTHSELRELWSETDDFDNWTSDITSLQQRLN